MLTENDAKRKSCPLKVMTDKGTFNDETFFGKCSGSDCMSWKEAQPMVERYDTPECRKELKELLPYRQCKSEIKENKEGAIAFIYLDSIGECRNPKVIGNHT